MSGIKGIMRYQDYNTKNPSIENLKNRWADNRISPYWFYRDFYKKYNKLGLYSEFLELINVFESITPELKKAIEDFRKVSI